MNNLILPLQQDIDRSKSNTQKYANKNTIQFFMLNISSRSISDFCHLNFEK